MKIIEKDIFSTTVIAEFERFSAIQKRIENKIPLKTIELKIQTFFLKTNSSLFFLFSKKWLFFILKCLNDVFDITQSGRINNYLKKNKQFLLRNGINLESDANSIHKYTYKWFSGENTGILKKTDKIRDTRKQKKEE